MGKSLYKGAIDPVVTHPLKVTQNGLSVSAAEYFRHPSIGVFETGRESSIWFEIRNIRPVGSINSIGGFASENDGFDRGCWLKSRSAGATGKASWREAAKEIAAMLKLSTAHKVCR